MTSVAVVVLDTLRKDRFDDAFEWLPGLRFERTYSTANWTMPSHASLFTGKYPSENGVHAKAPVLDVPGPVLPERLQAIGYHTRCWTANPNLSRKRRWDRGFDEFVSATQLLTEGDTVDWDLFGASRDERGLFRYLSAVLECFRSDYDTLDSLRQGIRYARGGVSEMKTIPDDGASAVLERARKETFGDDEFLFVNLMEAHTPYFPPPPYRRTEDALTVSIKHSLGDEEPQNGVLNAYDGAVDYLSSMYEKIFDELVGDFDYVFTISDHGEMLGEHDIWNHTYGLFPEITHVPCVVSGPGLDGTTNETVSLIDVHRTILSFLDVRGESRGRNLVEMSGVGSGNNGDKAVFAEYHGLIPVAVRRLREEGYSSQEIDRYEQPGTAIAAPPNYYGYQHEGEFHGSGTTVVDPRQKIQEFQSTLDPTCFTGDGTVEVNERQLEHLGYI